MKIFNLKRITAIRLNRIRDYSLYAIGEIILVVIGIVIGLQINKWNEARKIDKKIEHYYTRIYDESEFIIDWLEYGIVYSDSVIDGLTLSLRKISERDLDSAFQKNIKFLTDVEELSIAFPVLDEFIEQGYPTLIEDYELREELYVLEVFRHHIEATNSNIHSFGQNLLKTHLINKINYLDINLHNRNNSIFDLKKNRL